MREQNNSDVGWLPRPIKAALWIIGVCMGLLLLGDLGQRAGLSPVARKVAESLPRSSPTQSPTQSPAPVSPKPKLPQRPGLSTQ